ncbi:hypothetical protein LPA44_13845 [Halobacterium sp. KA-4]|uniref:hypothetical protein n=1 Tax=Halobacterium sp. KA-4 TaxID=2896367 RepID=UPI001E35F9FC|nr:hypothetical protein [Halobacterium sp. KA-4]MCD2200968.1 hypothetical protein [Halobacterium sp. KA-4]
MGLSGTTDSSVYEGLKDVLQRHPIVTTVAYEPDSIVKQFLRAQIDPSRVVPLTGPESPTLDIEWRFVEDEPYYRIHYADSNTGFNCGWHRDDDHPDLGPVHFQYAHPVRGERDHECAHFKKTIPTEILWIALDRLFEKRIPTLTNDN